MIRRRLAALGVAVGATVAMAGAFVSPASADPQTVVFQQDDGSFGQCIDDSFDNGLRAFRCNNTDYQAWVVTSLDSGWQTLRNRNTGRCIDDSIDYGLRAVDCNGLPYQNWHVHEQVPPDFVVMENDATQRCIDFSAQYGLRSFACNAGQPYQRWFEYGW
ncbi:RICIN domain-containing protein [Actinoallomurus sp. NBC_01490]|jgi:hypothetical protein|uniref:RICIN domain-containing protein n=1 Tax=Actinoallomurus sp. NBC_01490 TaxID=2903557 RepID=UPI002E3431B5|nr:ricin-type beta-trefoil lectin domain protein [Actinoallomurus sp. NBC_01490]